MRVCVAYDCLYPWTVGGAERWLRDLSEALAREGHDVTYLTRRQWDDGDEPDLPGVRVVAVAPREPLYGDDGNRRTGPPLRFGLGVLRHLLRHRSSYDAVHTCSFPYFHLPAARLALAGTGTQIGVDWFEVWSRPYWTRYSGTVAGTIGWLVQRLCVRLTRRAFVFSRLHARRLAEEGLRHEPIRLAGLYGGALEPTVREGDREPLVVFAGRHIPEKRAPLVPQAVAVARERIPGLRAVVLGDGPQREQVLEAAAGMDFVDVPGFVDAAEVAGTMGRATCLLLPSSREGYGMVVIEAAAHGTPTVVVAGEDNAAVELVEDGVNGFVARSEAPEDVADAVVRVHEGGEALRRSTAAWFARRARELSVGASLQRVLEAYGR